MLIRIQRLILPKCKSEKLWEIRKHFVRHNSSQTPSKVLECLRDRSVLRISGNETSDFLQGLITNDMKHFQEGCANIYSLFLNTKGRVLYDTIVYKNQQDDVFYIECDTNVVESLQKHLKMYRVRRQIDIENLQDKMNVWTLYDLSKCSPNKDSMNESKDSKLEGLIFPCSSLSNKASKIVDNIMIYEDPRLQALGFRVIAESKIERVEIMKHLHSDICDSNDVPNYREILYKLGIAEGVNDLPPGKAFPLEVNCDYLHGVSFHKGCYIGQELTARTYHTGVVRKRLMPLTFEEIPDKPFLYDEKIVNESGKVVGKFRGNEKKCGLGLMRITEALNAQSLNILGMKVQVLKPSWWPQESQKATASVDGRK